MKGQKLFSVALLTTALSISAFAQQSQIHNYPIDDATVEKYLQEYFGVFKDKSNTWSYISTTNSKANASQPTVAQVGDVLFIEVNDHFKGSVWKTTISLYDLVKYGMQKVTLVDKKSEIPTGMLYNYTSNTLNRFFFAIRTSDFYEDHDTSWFSGEGWKSCGTQKDPQYHYVNKYAELRWFNEFSAIPEKYIDDPSQYGWNQQEAAYPKLKDGDFYPVPHSCSNSLERNHFTSLADITSIGDYYSGSVFLYVPTKANATTTHKNENYKSPNIPQVFFYVNTLTGNRIDYTENPECNYAADLSWKTSFDRAKEAHTTDFNNWDGTKGVREESTVYRKYEGESEFTAISIGDKAVAVDGKTYIDGELKNPGKHGYYVTYKVVTKAVIYDGETRGNEIAEAWTKEVTIFIPGDNEFNIVIKDDFNSTYVPEANKFGESYNKITNDLSIVESETAIELTDIQVGDTFVLNRTVGSGEPSSVNTLVITNIETKGGKTTYTYTINGETKTTSSWKDIQDLLDEVVTGTDEIHATPGSAYDVSYQVVMTRPDGSTKESNVIRTQGKRTDVAAEIIYRSGTPDPANNAAQELYTVNVAFRALDASAGDLRHFNIWQNASNVIARVIPPVTPESPYYFMGQDKTGAWTILLGSAFPDDFGYVNFTANVALDHKVYSGEGDYNSEKVAMSNDQLFFTVEIVNVDGTSYGNQDKAAPFQGEFEELIVNTWGTFYKGINALEGQYLAQIGWYKVDHLFPEGDYVQQPTYYTLYRRAYNETGFSPVSKYYRDNGSEYEDIPGTLAADGAYVFTPEFMRAECGGDEEGFIYYDPIVAPEFSEEMAGQKFPYVYYVVAHYTDVPNDDPDLPVRSYVARAQADHNHFWEKNSNVLTALNVIPTGSRPTGIDDIEIESDVVSTTYYNLQGIEVREPAKGQYVVARYKHADGTVTSKVILP